MRHSKRLRNVTLGCGVMLVVTAAPSTSQVSAQTATASIRVQAAPEIAGVIKGGTQAQVIATGLDGADDPIWLPEIGLVFTEPNANRIVRLAGADTLTTFVGGLHRPLGMTFDREGRLISLQSEAGYTSVRVVWPADKAVVLAERFQVLPFSRPNGIVSDKKGGVYFSDPGLAPAQEAELRKTQARLPPAVYYVPRGGEPIQVADGIARPNGVHLSRDEKTLYVNDTNGIEAFAFDVLPDGRLSNRRVFATYAGRTSPLGGADGIASGADDLGDRQRRSRLLHHGSRYRGPHPGRKAPRHHSCHLHADRRTMPGTCVWRSRQADALRRRQRHALEDSDAGQGLHGPSQVTDLPRDGNGHPSLCFRFQKLQMPATHV